MCLQDERWPELAQNTGQLWVHEALAVHPRRTLDPAEADLFVVPLESCVLLFFVYFCARAVYLTPTPR